MTHNRTFFPRNKTFSVALSTIRDLPKSLQEAIRECIQGAKLSNRISVKVTFNPYNQPVDVKVRGPQTHEQFETNDDIEIYHSVSDIAEAIS